MPTNEIQAQATAKVEASDDAFLAGVFPAPPAQQPAKTETPAAASSAAVEVSESKAEPESVESDPDWEKACTTLTLDGVSQAMLAKLDRAEVLEWASKAKERQTKTSQELKAKAERIKALETAATPKGESPAPTPAGDSPELKALKETTFGDELAAPLTKLLERQAEELGKKYEDRIGFLTSILERQLKSTARAGLREQFPQVDDPERQADFDAEHTFQTGKFISQGVEPEEAFKRGATAAAKVLFHDEVQASNAGKALAKHRKQLASQPIPPNGKTAAPKAFTASEREDAILDAIFKGDVAAKESLMRTG